MGKIAHCVSIASGSTSPSSNMRSTSICTQGGTGGTAGFASHQRMPTSSMSSVSHANFTIPDDDNSVFKPSTHVMRREDSALGTMTTAAQLRHKELHVHHYDDED